MKTSIITITHNRAHLLDETIQSVLNQTFEDFELLVIDDGSDDNTKTVIADFKDSRIQYFKYQKSGKRSFLRNEGFRKATGDLIAVLDSDDLWAKDKLQKITTVFESEPNADFVFHNVSFIGDTSFTGSYYRFKNGFVNILDLLFSNVVLPFPIFTIRKTALSKIGFLDENMIDGQHDLYLRAAANLTVYYLDENLVEMRKHDQNISAKTDMRHYTDYLKAIEKLQDYGSISVRKSHVLKSRICNKMGYLYKQDQNFVLAKRHYRQSFIMHFANFNALKSMINYLKLNLTIQIESTQNYHI